MKWLVVLWFFLSIPSAEAVLTLNNFVGCETGGTEELESTGNTPTCETTNPRTGTYALELTGGDNDTAQFFAKAAHAGNDNIVGFQVRFSDITPAADTDFFFHRAGGAATDDFKCIGLRLEATSGDLILMDDAFAAEVDEIAAPFTVDTYHLIEIWWEDSATGDAIVHIDGAASGLDVTGQDFTNANGTCVIVGMHGDATGASETIRMDDIYIYSGATGVSDFLGTSEVFGYQSQLANATDNGDALENSTTWDQCGETAANDTNVCQYTGDPLTGSTDTDNGSRSGPSGDGNIDGDSNIKGGKFLSRMKRGSGGGGGTKEFLYGNTGDGTTADSVTLGTGCNNESAVVSESGTIVPTSSEFFRLGMNTAGGRDCFICDAWGMILHTPSAAGPTTSRVITITRGLD